MDTSASGDERREERRRYRRFQVATTAAVHVEDRCAGIFALDDLGAGGASLFGELPGVAVGDDMTIHVGLAGAYPLQLRGRLVRADVRGARPRFAVAFRDVEDATVELIEGLAAGGCVPPVPTALVVADDVGVHEALWFQLWRFGRGCLCVRTPLEAVVSLQEQQSAINVVIVARSLATADGSEVLGFATDHYPDVRRVLVSSSEDRDLLAGYVDAGRAHAVLVEPWRPRDLVEAIGGEPRPQ